MKNVPPELHDELRRRATDSGRTVGEVVLDAIRRDLRRRSTEEWVERMRTLPLSGPRPTREQVHEIWEDARPDRRFADDDDGR